MHVIGGPVRFCAEVCGSKKSWNVSQSTGRSRKLAATLIMLSTVNISTLVAMRKTIHEAWPRAITCGWSYCIR